jgi:DNA modification methylase
LNIDTIVCGDSLSVLKTLPDDTFQCCITSPPYYSLRDYKVEGQIGLEATPEEYIGKLIDIFREVRRVLKPDGICWLNIADSYAGSGQGWCKSPDAKQATNKGSLNYTPNTIYKRPPNYISSMQSNGAKPKDLFLIPDLLSVRLRSDGWWVRQRIIWEKNNPMVESVKDRCTTSHEYIFLLSKSDKYYSNFEALKEKAIPESWGLDSSGNYFGDDTKDYENAGVQKPSGIKKRLAKKYRDNPEYGGGGSNLQGHSGNRGADGTVYIMRNPRSVWRISTQPNNGSKNQSATDHFATYPEELVSRCMLAGSKEGNTILDPFMGSGTTALVALRGRRHYVGIELNPEYIAIADRRLMALKNQGVLI